MTPAGHDDAGYDAADWGREGGDHEAASGFGGGVEEDDLEEEREHEEELRGFVSTANTVAKKVEGKECLRRRQPFLHRRWRAGLKVGVYRAAYAAG